MLYRSETRPETDENVAGITADQTILDWLDRHPGLPAKFFDGADWHATESAAGTVAWFVLLELDGEDQLRVIGAGPRQGGSRHTVIGQPWHLEFGGVLFPQFLTGVAHDLLYEVRRAQRAATPSHRRPRRAHGWLRGRRD